MPKILLLFTFFLATWASLATAQGERPWPADANTPDRPVSQQHQFPLVPTNREALRVAPGGADVLYVLDNQGDARASSC